ncbi:MAG: sulfatase-like hydrolase/transferase [Puniceicoccaceae bacterium]
MKTYNRNLLRKLAGFYWILWFSYPLVAAVVSDRPNILYIFTDDQSYRTLSCYDGSYAYANTPNIDRLAEEGVLFTQAFTGAKCVPSRASTLTGRFQFNVTKDCTRYWPQDFRAQGYTTGMIGKWHWGKGTEMHQHGVAWDWSVVWDHGQKHEHRTYYWGQSVNINGGEPVKLDGYSTDRYTDYTVEFIEEQTAADKPWFFWLCYGAVHGPYTPAERHKDAYKTAAPTPIPEDIFGPRPGKPRHMDTFTKWKNQDGMPVHQDRSFDSWVKQYNEAVSAIDEGVGRIFKALQKNGQLDNTIIIFTSDQGFAWGDHGLRDKRYPYDAALRSPFIVYAPKRFAEGAVCDQPVNGQDIVRTIHSLAEVKPGVSLDGRDLIPLLEDPTAGGSWSKLPMIQTYTVNKYDSEEIEQAIREGDWESLMFDNSPSWMMLHDGRYKYTRYLAKDCIEELYDLESDPEELDNLAIRIEWKSKLWTMRLATEDAFRAKGAGFVDLLPAPRTGF